MAQRLEKESGCVRNYMQIREQIKQLKQSYKKVKDNNNLSGTGRKTFEFYEQVDQIMGDRPITKPLCFLDTGEPTEVGIHSDSETEESETQDGLLNNESDDIVNLSSPLSTLDSSTSSSLNTESNPIAPAQIAKGPSSQGDVLLKKDELKSTGRTLSSKRGKTRKRTRNEMFVSIALEMMNKQQALANERFFKLEKE